MAAQQKPEYVGVASVSDAYTVTVGSRSPESAHRSSHSQVIGDKVSSVQRHADSTREGVHSKMISCSEDYSYGMYNYALT